MRSYASHFKENNKTLHIVHVFDDESKCIFFYWGQLFLRKQLDIFEEAILFTARTVYTAVCMINIQRGAINKSVFSKSVRY